MHFLHLLSLLTLTLAANEVQTELLIERTLTHSCSRQSQKGDTIHAHYRGTLAADGKQFDASYDRGTPLSFKLGAGRVIKGWDLGLTDMCPGDKRKLVIPPELGYGSRGMGPIPANSVLVFETELVSIDGVAPEEKVVVPKEQVPNEEKHLEDVPMADAQMEVIDKMRDEAAVQQEAVKKAAEEQAANDAAKAAEDAKVEGEKGDLKEAVLGEPVAAKTEAEEPVQQENPQEELEKASKEEVRDEL